jgi:hypothetical protein
MKLLLWLACLSAIPLAVSAQSVPEPPLIQIMPLTPPEAVPPPASSGATPVPMTKSPRIEISPGDTSVGSTPVDADPAVKPADVTDADAEVTDVAPAEAGQWLLPMVPAAGPVATEVRIGASMPQPFQFRLSGETATAEFLLTVPDGVALPQELRLSLRSSINILPDGSRLEMRINGVSSEPIVLDNMGPFVERRVPAGGLTTGVNRISLTAIHTHRIFCGPEASFAVWTEVDIGHSGVLVHPALVPLNLQGFIAAMQSQVAAGGDVEILVDEGTQAELVREVARLISDALGSVPPIKVLPFYTDAVGGEARARVALITSPVPQVLFRRGAGGAVVMQFEHANSIPAEMVGLPRGELSNQAIAALAPGQVTTLAELGVPEILANTHYFRRDVDFLLPDDWLLLASQKAVFTIHYGYSGDLAKGSLLLFKVNGQTVRLLPLDRDGGEVLPPLDIAFRANRLNSGVNTLTFEMAVPGDPADLPCSPRRTDMLVVLGDSTLTVPPSPRMQQTDLWRGLARLGGEDVTVPEELADPTRDVATLVAFSALLRPLLADERETRLNVVGLDAVSLVPTGDTGVTRRILQNAVFPSLERATPLPDAEPAVTAGQSYSLGDETGAVTATQQSEDRDRVSPWQSVVQIFSAEGWLYRQIGGVRDLALPGRIALSDWLEGKSGRAMLLQLDPETPDKIWLVAGPDISMTELARAVDDFRRSGRSDVHGQAALLQEDGTWTTWSSRPQPQLLEPLTPWNLRAVLGNYASWSPLLFTLLMLLLALVSLVPALLFVLITRRSGSRT